MFSRFQRILVVLLICILPVQAMAVALVPISCAAAGEHEESAHMHSAHAHAVDTDVHGSAHGSDSGHRIDTAHGNLCCHQFASATPSIHVLATPQDFRVYDSAVALPAPLHIPELPQRPPRA